ncbi:unnamed protein product [Owenia fusiformis]|uniref:Uncharacterized protein n=1 Tax=Owenia fusiformis TaxID=6347 RepID=A0A8J1TEN8_OWEFU|nr:unnamed protein product [Owenia fusiformis]
MIPSNNKCSSTPKTQGRWSANYYPRACQSSIKPKPSKGRKIQPSATQGPSHVAPSQGPSRGRKRPILFDVDELMSEDSNDNYRDTLMEQESSRSDEVTKSNKKKKTTTKGKPKKKISRTEITRNNQLKYVSWTKKCQRY